MLDDPHGGGVCVQLGAACQKYPTLTQRRLQGGRQEEAERFWRGWCYVSPPAPVDTRPRFPALPATLSSDSRLPSSEYRAKSSESSVLMLPVRSVQRGKDTGGKISGGTDRTVKGRSAQESL